MAKFAYNTAKNGSTGYMSFKLNCGYHLHIFFKENTNPRSQSKLKDKLSAELGDLMTVYQKNLYQAQKFYRQAHNKSVKPRRYTPNDKVWLNSK